jgi:hypothetical protein
MRKGSNMVWVKFVLILFGIVLLNSVSAFQTEKKIVQLQVDEEYPCHLESNQIICPVLAQDKLDSWVSKIEKGEWMPEEGTISKIKEDILKEEINGKNKSEIITDINNKKIPFKQVGTELQKIDPTKEFKYKISITEDFSSYWKIGFGTNVFGVSGTTLENFDVNVTAGQVRYRPLNRTWFSFDGINDAIEDVNFNPGSAGINHTNSFWFNTSSPSLSLEIMGGRDFDLKALGMQQGKVIMTERNAAGTAISLTSPLTYNDSKWHYAIGTYYYNGSNMTLSLHIDGVLVNTTNISRLASGSNGRYRIGIDAGSASDFNGSLDEIRVYSNNAIINITQILEINNSGRIANYSLFYPNYGYNLWLSLNNNNVTIVNNLLNLSSFGLITGATQQSDNINVTTLGYQVNISIVNQSNALVFWNNFTLINNSRTGNDTYSFINNQTIFILDNFNLTENVSRQNSPLSICGSTKDLVFICSNLTSSISSTVVITPKNEWGTNCGNVNKVVYTPKSGNPTTYTGDSAKTFCQTLTTTGQTLTINPSSNSNELKFEYGTTPLSSIILKLLIGFLALTVLLFAIGGFMYYVKDNFSNVSPMEFIKYAILLLLFTVLMRALINHILEVI